MADILQEFTVKASPERVFDMFATPDGLDRWWTQSSSGQAKENAEYRLCFGPGYDWRARVTRCSPGSAFELLMTQAHEDWKGTRVGCQLEPDGTSGTLVRFYHAGWPEQNEHWRVSCYCWAMYLRLLRRNLEHAEFVPYEKRLDA
ncbi:MAG TPA: SRPBCC domain-containing protein [Candidatus Cybelea sp.]|nr:SRPBCC domain-containing protein [Candidatus Cybelea sp.]